MRLPKWLGWLLKCLPGKAKEKAFDYAVDKMSEPKEREVIAPKTQFNTSRLEWREIQNNKQKPKKKGK